jgi:hypothetical protein
MIQQLENAISKLSELSETEQEAIAQIIMTNIESKKEKQPEKSEPNSVARKAKLPSRLGSGKSILRHAGKWVGDDLEECLEMVYSSRGEAEF